MSVKRRAIKLPRRAKYRAVPTTVDGIRFASKREAGCYSRLKVLEKAGEISGLETQPPFPLHVQSVLVCTYVADFRYLDLRTGEVVVADAKGFLTTAYKIKKKLMLAIHGIAILEM